MEKEEIIKFIKERSAVKKPLNSSYIQKEHSSYHHFARKIFGSWRNAIEESGIDYSDVSKVKHSVWTKDHVIEKIQELNTKDLSSENLRKNNNGLYTAAIRLFGSRKNALIAAGINYEETLLKVPWTKERVISTIQMLHANNIPLNFKYVGQHYTRLRKMGTSFFGSWGEAVAAAGFNYEEIKKNKGWAKPFLSDDKTTYISQVEGLVANELLRLKKIGKITDYLSRQQVTPGKFWTCDFVLILNSGAKLWLEVDGLGKSRQKPEQQEEKIEFYIKANYFFHKISSYNSLENIIDRYILWYTIPKSNSLITTHKNPDGDALASARAVYNYIKEAGKSVAIRVAGDVPKNLSWILKGLDQTKKIPEWVENIIVLDCALTEDRIGWVLPENKSVLNIDHHESRLSFNDPDNFIHVINGCSTASILYSRFGIKDSILPVGVYTDTLFTQKLPEVFHFLTDFNVDEELLNKHISKISVVESSHKIIDIINNIKFHRCRNGFLIGELKESVAPGLIENIMQILSKTSESVCLIYDTNVIRLRTSNSELDLSELAQKYSGGGHKYAAGCVVEGNINEFKSTIISWKVPKIEIKMDGYEEGKGKKNEDEK